MSSKIVRHGGAGVVTAEGVTAGPRAAKLARARAEQAAEFEAKKQAIAAENASVARIGDKFAAVASSVETTFKAKTVGLVSLSEYKAAMEEAADAAKKGPLIAAAAAAAAAAIPKAASRKRKRKARKAAAALLSFGGEEEEEEEAAAEPAFAKTKTGKDPSVETSFLPDADRESLVAAKRAALEAEWEARQAEEKAAKLEVTYSYWDGSGHRKSLRLCKGDTIGKFLGDVYRACSSQFPELRGVRPDSMIYIKEDLIIPHHFAFYDLIATKARGKSGPLFHFDVHDDVRSGPIDSRVEKDESHPGKVVTRAWYERNKHIFPASRWEVYDAHKVWGRYTIAGEGGAVTQLEDEDPEIANSVATKGIWSVGAGL
jgi:protein FAM50